MINKTLKLAEKIGSAIAQGNYNIFSVIFNNDLKHDGYIWYKIKQFKELDNALSKRSGFIKSFASVSQNIYMISTGNKSNISFLIGIPLDMKSYFENIYFSYFDTGDLNVAISPVIHNAKFIDWKENTIHSDSDFIKNGQYLDPRKDMLSLYDNIYQGDILTLLFIYKFKTDKSLIDKFNKIYISANIEEKPVENKFIMKFGVGYSMTIGDIYIRQQTENNIKSSFGKYISNGDISISNSLKLVELSINQVVNFFHFLDNDNLINGLEYSLYRKLPFPVNLPDFDNIDSKNDLTVIGTTDYRYEKKLFGIKSEDKLRHMYIIGKTGTGKSKLISNLIKSDMISNKGVCLLDPHGDLVDDVLAQVPSYRINDVVLFDVADVDFPIGFNIFEFENESEKSLIASGVVSIFKKLYDNSRGPRLEYILRNVILSILDYPNATLLHLVRMLTDNNFKEEVLSYVSDPVILKFWRDEFDKRQPKQKEEAIAPITNKVGQFTSSKIVRNIFGQGSTKLNLRKMMDEGKIILMNLSKGRIGEDSANMIGSFVVSKLQIDAMSRADTSEKDRKEFYLYIDEFQNFATDSFGTILSEARKYKLGLVVANQFSSQLDEKVRSAIFGNVGTIVCMTVGYDDAAIMANQFKGLVTINDILSLPNRTAYIRLKINGKDSDTFSMKTADRTASQDSNEIKQKVRNQSRQRYAIARTDLEAIIKVRSEKKFTASEKVTEKAKELSRQKNLHNKQKEQDNIYTQNNLTDSQNIDNQIDQENHKSDNITNIINNIYKPQTKYELPTNQEERNIKDMEIGKTYDGLIKLRYNFGLFVTVLGVEGLLHKNFIKTPGGINWKQLYNIGDPIKVKLSEIKEINGQTKAIRTQENLDK